MSVILLEVWTISAMLNLGSVDVDLIRLEYIVTSANQDIGISLTANSVLVMVTQIFVTRSLGIVLNVGITQPAPLATGTFP